MITILALIIFCYVAYNIWADDIFGWAGKLGCSVFALLITTLITSMILFLFASVWRVEVKRDDCSAQIYSLKAVNGIEGAFCLGSGYIGSQEYYYMFQKYNDGGLRRLSLRSADCIIFQNENSNPHFSWQKIHYRLPYWALWPDITKLQTVNDSMYYIYIPSNSVVLKFNVD